MKNYIIGIVLLLVAGFLMLDPLQWQPRAVPVEKAPNEPFGFADANRSTESRSSLDHFQPKPNARTRPMAMPPLPFRGNPNHPERGKAGVCLGKRNVLRPSFPIMRGIGKSALKKQGRLSKDYNMTHEGEPLLSPGLGR